MAREAQVWLVGVQRAVRNVLRSTFPSGHNFRIAATVQDAMRALNAHGDDFSQRPPATYTAPSRYWSTLSLFTQASFEGKDRRATPRGIPVLQAVSSGTERHEVTSVE
jgi:hypothetical protein